MRAATPRIDPGARFGPYTLEEALGKGASAVVWRGVDGDGRVFAIKVRRRGDPAMDRRFLREFESMRSLRLPGVVRVYEAGIEDQHLWFSMDLVEGKPFYKHLHAAQDMTERVRRVIDASLQLLEILSALHQAGFVHRDLKPSNVLIDDDGGVHVLDFGIVRFFAGGEHTSTTNTGAVLGTIPFMAPEQLSGLPNDHTVDIFACGLMIHEGIHGRRARPAVPIGWIPRTCMERLSPLATLYAEVPRGLSHIVERMLSVDPRDRPSAPEVTRALRSLAGGRDTMDCPEPRWVEPGDWMTEIEGLIGHEGSPPIWVLEGPAGSGKGRCAEQIHRQAIMQGVWPLHLRARIDRVGGPLLELLELLLSASTEETWSSTVVEDDGALLRRMWPGLHVPGAAERGDFPGVEEVADAVSRCLARMVTYRPTLLILHDAEQVDPVTSRALARIARHAGPSLGLMLLHDPRWGTRESERLVARLRTVNGAGLMTIPPITHAEAKSIIECLCPAEEVSEPLRVNSPQEAVEVGNRRLARWRREAWESPGTGLWALAVRDAPIPESVLEEAGLSEVSDSRWTRRNSKGITFAARFARDAARARLPDARVAARSLAGAWEQVAGQEQAPDVAILHMLAGDTGRAWLPAARAALHAEKYGLYAEARGWLFLLDTLPRPAEPVTEKAFDLSLVRARVALRTEVGTPRRELLEICESLAVGEVQQARARLLRAEYDLREGHATKALVASLRVASNLMAPAPHTAVRGLLGAVLCRFVLGQTDEIPLQLDKARMALIEHPDALLEVQLDDLRAEYFLRRNDLSSCRTLSTRLIQRASEARYMRGAAFAASRLGRVLRQLGRRREAEHHTRSARDAFANTGDIVLNAETGLALATLLVERGDTAGARHLLDDSIRHIRGLHLDDLLPGAMRVALDIAIFRNDPTDAAVALEVLGHNHTADPEVPSVLVRWWRIRGDIDRAMLITGPDRPGYGRCLWHIERARVAMMAGWDEVADEEATAAIELAADGGFEELGTYARLILGVAMPESAPNWDRILGRAQQAMWTEVYLGALEMDARRMSANHRYDEARSRLRTLEARAKELGYLPGVEEAEGWLARINGEEETVTVPR